MSHTFIYGLIDPLTLQVRYIGKSNNPYRRLYGKDGHIKNKYPCHCHYWIQSLLIQKLKPSFCILEQCENLEWQEREKNWIDFGRRIGWPLTNLTDGGDGGKSGTFSEDHKRKISAALKGKINHNGQNNSFYGRHHSESTKIKLREINKGKHLSSETRKKISLSSIGHPATTGMTGKHHTEETRKKIAENNRNRPNEIKRKLTFKGRHHSQESLLKLRKPKSKEHKEKLRIAALKRRNI